VSARSAGEQDDVGALVANLPVAELRAVLSSAVDRHPDVERHLRLVAARATGDLVGLRREVDRGLRTRRFLAYRESSDWARAARPVVDELRLVVAGAPSRDLVVLLERALGHVVKVIQHADDSNGTIGDLARDLLALHAQACDALVADPLKLAAWMVRFSCEDQDFFEVDPVRYARALGGPGLAAYRRGIAARDGERLFAVRWARERLAVLDGDTQAIVTLLGGNLTNPHQFIRVCQAMAELGRDDEVLSWARRGITETQGWQVAQLYDLACEVHDRHQMPVEVLALRREHHERMASAGTYRALRGAADALDAWEVECGAARAALRERDRGELVEALLGDGDADAAWAVATEDPAWNPGGRRLRLAEAREATRPAEALVWYLQIVDDELKDTGRAAYARGVAVLKRARRAAQAAGEGDAFATTLAQLRERHRRRPTLIAMLDKAALS
jgi:hypothetical protein